MTAGGLRGSSREAGQGGRRVGVVRSWESDERDEISAGLFLPGRARPGSYEGWKGKGSGANDRAKQARAGQGEDLKVALWAF